MSDVAERNEQAARSLALEQAYVHDVYEQCAERTLHSRPRPRIQQFLEELEPGALVCDIGCGNGKYLKVNHNVFKVGGDRCRKLAEMARDQNRGLSAGTAAGQCELMTCDNLALPFRDESFDAVLSICVVHHLSSTERRVRALKELARVLRIGGRLIISVWAMEQKHRKFESQDVLVPWPKAYCLSSAGGSPIKPRGFVWDEHQRQRDRNGQSSLSGKREKRRGSKVAANKAYWIEPIFSPSPSTSSSLSSPNETCYSFFRRALQKLAGGRRNSRAWFLDNWQQQNGAAAANGNSTSSSSNSSHSGSSNGPNGYALEHGHDEEDEEDVDDLPIELRRLEDPLGVSLGVSGCRGSDKRDRLRQQSSDSSGMSAKSKSLSSLHVELQRSDDLVRSRSSLPLPTSGQASFDEQQQQQPDQASKPKLVKQKQHLAFDDACLDDLPEDTAIDIRLSAADDEQNSTLQASSSSGICSLLSASLSELPKTILVSSCEAEPAEQQQQPQQPQLLNPLRNVCKQSSMNEEIMSFERLKERESVHRNIMKQASLNEELIYNTERRPTLEALRDSIYSASASRRFQLLKSGLTNRIRQSTTNIEKVSSAAIKNAFVGILQSWKSTESPTATPSTTTTSVASAMNSASAGTGPLGADPNRAASQPDTPLTRQPIDCPIERRLSREDGSDSSKDSSLQSDTSVDSEDSFASVIYVPKKSSSPLLGGEAAMNASPLPSAASNLQFIAACSAAAASCSVSSSSAPPSPRLKDASQRLKMMNSACSPLLKQQFPATSKSLPPTSPPGLSPRMLSLANARPFFPGNESPLAAPASAAPHSLAERVADMKRSFDASLPRQQLYSRPEILPVRRMSSLGANMTSMAKVTSDKSDKSELTRVQMTINKETTMDMPTEISIKRDTPDWKQSENVQPHRSKSSEEGGGASEGGAEEVTSKAKINNDESSGETNDKSSNRSLTSCSEEEETLGSRKARLNQIKELLKQKPGFAARTRPAYPLVRRASTASGKASEAQANSKLLPRLLSLELFNPETDDLDSDSSGLSSPESCGSVISVVGDKKKTASASSNSSASADKPDDANSDKASQKSTSSADSDSLAQESREDSSSRPINVLAKSDDQRLAKNDIDKAMENLLLQKNKVKLDTSGIGSRSGVGALDRHISPIESTWNEECSRQLEDLRDRLGENLIQDIDQFCRMSQLADAEHDGPLAKKQTRATRTTKRADSDHDATSLSSGSDNQRDEGVQLSHQRSCGSETDSASFDEPPATTKLPSGSLRSIGAGSPPPHLGRKHRSIESSDIGDSIEHTMSSDSESIRRSGGTSSTASLATTSSSFNEIERAARAKLPTAVAAAAAAQLDRGQQQQQPRLKTRQEPRKQQKQLSSSASRRSATSNDGTLSGSSSQESLPSDQMTYHQYYHVFREGELDQLIDKYVENLHVISSYYDHASWCIVAEKVQVWTI
ncbi:mucin-5AC-like [Trichogramma pretiosum]|uniref:mucin-5AC-like n=1 Tax=Trichogramma pretiosum TaxID=7493 RepID=UPI0006C94D2C|nr:mucin-5AC-like [Trichogramma pretiosum]XP_023318360.1 mucin-5AC-like [Trichogramma pretiosum]